MLRPWYDDDTWDYWDNGIDADGYEAAVAPDASIGSTSPGETVGIDVTASLAAWSAGESNLGWVFLHAGPSNDGWLFYSSEAEVVDWRPELQVTYSPPCLGDIAGPCGLPDGVVGVIDFLTMLANWGACP
jgi:hypothetical protein